MTPAETLAVDAYVGLGVSANLQRLARFLRLAPSTTRNQMSATAHKLPQLEKIRKERRAKRKKVEPEISGAGVVMGLIQIGVIIVEQLPGKPTRGRKKRG